MRRTPACAVLISAGALLCACPPLTDEYEVVEAPDAASGGVGGSAGIGGSSGSGGVSGSGGSAGACDPGSCTNTCCGAVCADTTSDPKHCGGCDRPCPSGRNCNFGQCGPSGWVAVAKVAGEPSPREMAAHAWTGERIFIWGGADASGTALDDGALYDPWTGSWTAIANTPNAPSPRVLATAVTIGQKVVVWGGGDASSTVDYKDGGIYDLTTQSWTAIGDGPAEARAAIGAAAGSDQVLFWGGFNKEGKPMPGTFLLNVSTGDWTVPSNATAPPALLHPAWAASSSDLNVCGGRPDGLGDTDLCWRAVLSTGTWSALPKGPSARFGAFGAWDGASFFVWSGTDGAALKTDGKLLIGTSWATVDNKGSPPAARWAAQRRSGWSYALGDQRFLIAGGLDVAGSTFHKEGGIYLHTTGSWTPVPAWPSGEDHEWGVAVWTGVELVLWGGRNGAGLSNAGERYLPPPP